jgi:hypothetical protein
VARAQQLLVVALRDHAIADIRSVIQSGYAHHSPPDRASRGARAPTDAGLVPHTHGRRAG